MRKTFFLFPVLFLLHFGIYAQVSDSASVARQVDSLIQVSRALTGKRDFEKALEVNEKAKKMALEGFRQPSGAYGNACFNHGRVLYFKGDLEEAEKWYLESISIRSMAPGIGKTHPDYAWSLNNLGSLYKDKGNYEKAEALYLEAKDIREKALGNMHPNYAGSLHNLASLYMDTGDYEKAESLYLEAKKIGKFFFESAPSSYDYALNLNNLAILYIEMGYYEKAERLYLEAKDIREKIFGREHPDYAASLNNLANLYRNLGNFEKAEPLFLEANNIWEKTRGKNHSDFASGLNNLANLYSTMGSNEKAELLYLKARDIWKEAHGQESSYYAIGLHNLASFYAELGDYVKAEQHFIEAKNIREKTLGKNHPDYANSLNGLAAVFINSGNFERAEFYCLEAKEILLLTLGKYNTKYAAILQNLAILYTFKGDYEKAEPLYFESKEIFEKILGKEHRDYAENLNALIRFFQKSERFPEASNLILEGSKLNRLLVERAASFSSENQIKSYLKTFEASNAEYQSYIQRYPNPELLRECYNNALFFNGLTLENNRLLTRTIGQSDSLTRQIYEKWMGCQRRLAKRYARPLEERKKIAEVEAEAEVYEKQLIRSLPAFQQARKVPTWKDVRDQLKADEATIEFLHYPFLYPKMPDSLPSPVYAALILRPGWEAPKLVPLCEEKQLQALLPTHGERKADYVAALYSVSNRGIIEVKALQKTLYELIWKPMEPALEGVTRAYFSPRGLLHRINLAAIPINSDSTLSDKYHLITLGSTRQLVAESQTAFTGHEAMLFGGIRFDMDSTAIFAANESLKNTDLASRGLAEEGSFESSTIGEQWNYLKWTDREVKALNPILSGAGFSPETRTGFDATEEAFKSIGASGESPRILHIATHGFFFPDPKTTGKKQEETNREVGFKANDNPLMRSGLLLAGANHAWQSGKPFKKGMENGILTAFEISHLDLSNTELVVLSACETGLGDIQGNEGVFGLQRAFKIAGVKYLIMSLWQVPDFQTQELMTTFYTKWLSEKMTIPEAFRSAQQEMREKYENPYFWAGFVLVE